MKKAYLEECIQKSLIGEKYAFKLIMEEYADYVFSLAFQIVNHEEDAKDIVQETFIRIWKNLASYNSRIKFTTWIYKITYNLCIDKIRKRKRQHTDSIEQSNVIMNILSNEDPEQVLEKKEVREILIKLSENLSSKQKAVYILQDIQEKSPKEIEQITGMSKGKIKSNLYYARKEIKKQLIKIGYDL